MINVPTLDPFDGVVEINDYTQDFELTCDAVVVGSGPTGALAAYNLVQQGLDVVMLEAGPVRRVADFTLEVGQSLAEATFDRGLRVLRGTAAMPTIQARVLGGGSVINSAMSIRAPQFAFDQWQAKYQVETFSREFLDPYYQSIEDQLGIRPTEEHALGQKNILFRQACDNLGISSEPTPRNVSGCQACGECLTGCHSRAKKSVDITYIPEAIKKGLRVYTSISVDRVLHSNGVARGIEARVVDPITLKPSYHVKVQAPTIVMAAGCIGTPVILQKSNAPDPHNMIGTDLQAHPGAAIMGVFEEPVNPWVGATQGYHTLEYLERGYKIEVLWTPPALLAVRLPDIGKAFKDHLAAFKHGAIWDAIYSTSHSFGKVKARRGSSPDIQYGVDIRDMPLVQEGVGVLMDMFTAAGAHSLIPGIKGLPSVVKTSDKPSDQLKKMSLHPRDLVLGSTHLFASTRMGPDRTNSVVDELGQMHHLRGCYIVDTGVLPKSPSVNPMLTGMAVADYFSQELATKLSRTA